MKSYKVLQQELNKPSESLIEDIMSIIAIREADQTQLYEAFDADCDYILNEGIMDVLKMDVRTVAKNVDGLLNKGLKKVGLHKHKGKGIISYIMSAGKGVGKMVLAGIRGDTETVKELAQSVKKEDVLDFVLKLDMATQHLITGPIHMIDAWTGWHIGANLENVIRGKDGVVAKIKGAFQTIKQNISHVVDKARIAVFNKNIAQLEAEIS